MLLDDHSSSGWESRALVELADYHNGMAFKPSDWSEEGTRIIRIQQLNDPTGSYDHYSGFFPEDNRIVDGDLIFSWSATLKVAIWKHGPGVLNQHLFKVVPKPGVDKHFLFHILDFHMDDIAGGSHGSTMRHIKRGELKKYHVYVPEMETEQRKIARILTTVDNLIERTEALIAKVQAVKQGLLHDLLTRGVDAQGRLRPPREDAPDLYKESPLGWIPREWEVDLAHALFEMRLGKMLSKESKKGINSFPYLANRNVQWDCVDVSNLDEMDFTEAERQKYSLEHGDLLICEGGEVGRSAIWHGELEDCYFQKAIHRCRPKDNRILSAFFLRYMRFAALTGRLEHYTSQTSIAHLTGEKLAILPVPLPVPNEQLKIVSKFESIDLQIEHEMKLLGKYHELKTGLMQDLLTGEVRVRIEDDSTPSVVATEHTTQTVGDAR
jgi:type I restriction enzyme S subunit